MYMRPGELTFYKANRVGEHRIENFSHQLTSDVDHFSICFTEVLSDSLKPMADFLVYSVLLTQSQGLATPLTLYAWFACATLISDRVSPSWGELAATKQHLEGRFVRCHAHLIESCEQVAFLGGEEPEKHVLDCTFDKLLAHVWRSLDLSFRAEVVTQYLKKYFPTVIGLYLIARPLRLRSASSPTGGLSSDQVAQYFTSSWQNLTVFASAIQFLVLRQALLNASRRLETLSGYAGRVSRLMGGLEQRPPVLQEELELARRGAHPPELLEGPTLKFEHDLNLCVEPGQRVLITGENGCGKSSLFRVMRRLWPLVEGRITMPSGKIHFLTQASFVPVGTLRDVVIYPQSSSEMLSQGRTDREVHACLRWAFVSPQVIRDGRAQLEFSEKHGRVVRPELGDVMDWRKELSPGQKQRLAFARLFYHRPAYSGVCPPPTYAILDECTNGVSPDVEHELYSRCAKLKLGVLSIAHKTELKLFHDYELHYNADAHGSWTLSQCSETLDK
ncbi:unnamed protein product, partial [Prorocentrum cordatum]